MRNFDYLQDIEALKDLYGFCSAVDTQQTNYDVCALNGRRALEWIVKAVYTLKGIELDKRTNLLEMMSSEPFTQFIGDDDKLMMAAHYVRKIGNKAAHDGGVKSGEAIDLMENGLKINGGDTIGKTIIFAYNHNHAVLIVDRFKQLYPALGDDFCQLIDNTVNYAQSLIDTFEVRGKMPQIAVSVDMLDTGIDVPDILNLVFFKQVRSKIKFLQMIGRGTRLSEEIFDEGETPEDRAKKFFYIFDRCGNFEFFGENPKGYEPLKSISLTQRLFDLRVDLAIALQHEQYQNDEVAKALHDEVKAILMGQVKELNDKHISVREHWDMVDKYRRKETWAYLSNTDGIELKDVIAPLLVNGTTNMGATKFDILMLNIELSQIDEAVSGDKSKLVVEKIANKLQEKASIKQVNDKMPLIKQLSKHEFWETASLDKLEYVRKEIRDLVQFITGITNQKFTINIKDTVEAKGTPKDVSLQKSYKQRVMDFLAENKELPVIQKIVKMEKLSFEDICELEKICWKELGTKEDYEKFIAKSNMICGDSVGAFIRSQIGVDRHVAMERFSQFLSDTTLNSLQEEYIKSIITYVCDNGDITPNTLLEEEPFAQYEWIDTFGKNFIAVRNYVNEIHNIVRVANGESMSQASSQPTMKVATPSRRSKKAQEVRFIPSGSILTNILDDNEVRKLIHNMMELEDGTTIDTIYLECQREFQERYFSMTGNEWRHLVSDYVREVTQQPNLQEKEVFRFAMAV